MWDLTVPGDNDHDFYVLAAEARERTQYAKVGAEPILVHNENSGGECLIAGSGTTKGILEVSSRVKSVGAVRNFNPSTARDFVFDAQSSRFATGADQGVGGHDFLRMAIGSSEDNPSLVGGRILGRGEDGEFITNEWSGHYGNNWTDTIRQQFSDFMNQYGLTVQHNVGFGTGQ
jgi:Bacterial toxin 43